METIQNRSESEIRADLIAAARGLTSRDGNISISRLCAESGVSREDFNRCFADKAALLSAIVDQDVVALENIAATSEVRAERRVAQGGGDFAVVAAPTDQWLERRLRVFERALAALESRQDKSERDVARNLALLDEKFAALPQAAVTGVPDTAADAPEAAEDLPQLPFETAPSPLQTDEAAGDTPLPLLQFKPQDDNPISEGEIADFIAHARLAAQRAVPVPPPAPGMSLPRWIAWMGVVAVTGVVCAGLFLTNARATQPPPGAGVTIRIQPPDTLGRLVALADSGDARAQTLLALAYLRGSYGAKANSSAALRWSLAAARQGEPVAQYLIGALSAPKDAAGAASWFEQSAERGNLKAMHNLAIAYAQGQGVVEDDRRAAAWFNRAAEQGYVDSQFDLAVLFERGQGVTQNRISALKWYLIAAKGGDAAAQQRADQLRGEMPDDEAARAEQLAADYHPQPHDIAANAIASP